MLILSLLVPDITTPSSSGVKIRSLVRRERSVVDLQSYPSFHDRNNPGEGVGRLWKGGEGMGGITDTGKFGGDNGGRRGSSEGIERLKDLIIVSPEARKGRKEGGEVSVGGRGREEGITVLILPVMEIYPM